MKFRYTQGERERERRRERERERDGKRKLPNVKSENGLQVGNAKLTIFLRELSPQLVYL